MKDKFVKFQMEFSSNLKYIELLDEFLNVTLKKNRVPDVHIVEIIIATIEGVSNAIIHGNKNNADLKVKVVLEFFKDKVVVLIKDSGNGFNPECLKNCKHHKNILKPSGRGVFIIKSYMDKISFDYKKGTILKMEKIISP